MASSTMGETKAMTTTLHSDGMRRRIVIVAGGGKEEQQQQQQDDDHAAGTPRKKTTVNTSSIYGSGSPTTDIVGKKNAGAVNNGDKKSKRKNRPCQQQRGRSRALCSVFVFFGLCVAYVLFQRHHTSNNDADADPPSLLKRFNNIFPLKKATNTTLGDGPVPRPKDWHLWGYHTFLFKFNCSGYLEDETKPIPTMEYWQTMLDLYNEVVDPTYTFDDVVPPTQGYRFYEDGPPPYYPKLSPGKGRGLFASRDITKGEIVHDGTKSDVIFPNETSWKRFMFALPRTMACDNALWTFTQEVEEDGPIRIVSSLNIAILMNEANNPKEVNTNVQPENGEGVYSEYSSVFFATKDIKKDEEILMNYDDYSTDYAAAGLEDLVLSMLSCTSFETCSLSELTLIMERVWSEGPGVVIGLVALYILVVLLLFLIYEHYVSDALNSVNEWQVAVDP